MTVLQVTQAGAVLTVRIANPPTDLLDRTVIAELLALGEGLRRDHSVRAVVVTGPRPGVFVPHYELAEILAGSEALGLPTPYPVARVAVPAVAAAARIPALRPLLRATPAAGLVDLADTHRALRLLAQAPAVVIMAIDGDAQGGGCELALAGDVRVMSDGPYLIGLPELSAGIPPGAGGTQRLMAAVGPARARALVLQARSVTPAEALAAGLVDLVVPPGEALAVATDLAQRVARWNPAAVRAAKRAMRPRGSAAGLHREGAGFVAAASGADARAWLRAFTAASRPDEGSTPWRDRTDVTAASVRTPAPPAP